MAGSNLKQSPCKDDGTLELPWLKWRVDGLWHGVSRLEKRFGELEKQVKWPVEGLLDSGSWESRLKLVSDRLKELESQHAGIGPNKSFMQVLDMRLEKQMAEVERICSQFCNEHVQARVKESVDGNIAPLENALERFRADSQKEFAWVRDTVELELGIMSTKVRNLMLDMDSAQLHKNSNTASEKKERGWHAFQPGSCRETSDSVQSVPGTPSVVSPRMTSRRSLASSLHSSADKNGFGRSGCPSSPLSSRTLPCSLRNVEGDSRGDAITARNSGLGGTTMGNPGGFVSLGPRVHGGGVVLTKTGSHTALPTAAVINASRGAPHLSLGLSTARASMG